MRRRRRRKVRDADFDVVLTDMRMPVVDGLEVTRRIRALPGYRGRTPVVLVTADLVALTASASGQTGVDACVRKPFTRAELLTAKLTAARASRPVPDEPSRDRREPRHAAPERSDLRISTFSDEVLDMATLADLKQTLGHCEASRPISTRRLAGSTDLLRSAGDARTPTQRPCRERARRFQWGMRCMISSASRGYWGLTALAADLRWFDTAHRIAPAPGRRAARIRRRRLCERCSAGRRNSPAEADH